MAQWPAGGLTKAFKGKDITSLNPHGRAILDLYELLCADDSPDNDGGLTQEFGRDGERSIM
jgi:hypothetical protein